MRKKNGPLELEFIKARKITDPGKRGKKITLFPEVHIFVTGKYLIYPMYPYSIKKKDAINSAIDYLIKLAEGLRE